MSELLSNYKRDKSRWSWPVTGAFRLDRVNAIVQVANELGLPFRAESGEQHFKSDEGANQVVKPGYAFVSIGTGREKSLAGFWKKVDQICPPPWIKPQSK